MGWIKSVEFRRSRIHGMGVFAAEPIAAGEKVWRFDESMNVCGPGELGGLSPDRLAFALHGGYFHAPEQKFVWYEDGMEYVNHADPPSANIGIRHWTPLREDNCTALRDIEPGEELLEDYEFWSIFNLPVDHWARMLCRDFCRHHYDFLLQLHYARNRRRSIA